MAFEEALASKMFSQSAEKSYIDKILAKSDSEKINSIMQKNEWTKEDIQNALYLVNNTELKLGNTNDNEREIILKHFLYIGEIARLTITLLDYYDYIKKRESFCNNCEKLTNNKFTTKLMDKNYIYCSCENPKTTIIFDKLSEDLILRCLHSHIEAVKSMLDTHCGILRSSLSMNALGIKKLTEQKYDIEYNTTNKEITPVKKGIFGF